MESKRVDLYNLQDGLRKRDGGPYLDQVQREEAEIVRARVEGREPDLDNPGAHAGTALVRLDELLRTANVHTPSQENNDPLVDALSRAVSEKDFPVDLFTSVEVTDKSSYGVNPADPTTRSKNPKQESAAVQFTAPEPESKTEPESKKK